MAHLIDWLHTIVGFLHQSGSGGMSELTPANAAGEACRWMAGHTVPT